jgi:hypothetical protein
MTNVLTANLLVLFSFSIRFIRKLLTFLCLGRTNNVETTSESNQIAPVRQPDCIICLEPLPTAEKQRIDPCGDDAFHHACISDWLRIESKCPLCRQFVTSVAGVAIEKKLQPVSAEYAEMMSEQMIGTALSDNNDHRPPDATAAATVTETKQRENKHQDQGQEVSKLASSSSKSGCFLSGCFSQLVLHSRFM